MGMTESQLTNRRTSPEPLPDNIRSVQPGGGACYRIELAWGRLRRWYLARFRPAYVRRMAELRQGDAAGAPHAILDPRDLKYCRNLCSAHWHPGDDPFRWRERIPVARWGLAEIQLLGYPLLALAILLAAWWWYLAVVPAVLLALVVYFFRDPPRRVPAEPGILVSPADGVVAEVTRLEHDDFIDGPAVRIGIFLSIFNVHINRAGPGVGRPAALLARVISQCTQSGKRDQEREHVDRVGRVRSAASATGSSPDRGLVCPAHRL